MDEGKRANRSGGNPSGSRVFSNAAAVARTTIRTFKDLRVWQRAYAFCVDIYQATAKFPDEEKYGLTAQMRRCAEEAGKMPAPQE